MSGVIDRIRRQATLRPQRLLLAEGTDERILRAAERLHRDRIAEVAIVGAPDAMRGAARRAGAGLGGVRLHDVADSGATERTAAALAASRGDRLSAADRARCAADPLFQAAAMVRAGDADAFVAGAVRTTADVLRAGLWLIGLEPGVRLVSSFFLMVLRGPAGDERVFVFADGAVVPEPTAAQLADIGILAAEHYQRLTGSIPHTAFLSFSTRGSASHPRVDRVREACGLARAQRPDLHFDGELQLDAAIVPSVASRKAPDSVVAGHANVLIFPDLDSGNIGYKLVQRLAGAEAYGPILMGLDRQANDLSRGCSAADVVGVATIACALAAARTAGHA
jgi:phosphate acetyltransferase